MANEAQVITACAFFNIFILSKKLVFFEHYFY